MTTPPIYTFEEMVEIVLKHLPPNTLITIFSRIYEYAKDRVDSEFGYDHFNFGTDLWRSTINQMQDLAEKYEIDYISNQTDVRVFIPKGIELAFRRVKGSKNSIEDISTSFPNTAGCCSSVLKNSQAVQLILPLEGLFSEIQKQIEPTTHNLVIAHNGNEVRGLNGIYIGQPKSIINNRIHAWENTYTIYEAEKDMLSASYASPTTQARQPIEKEQKSSIKKVEKPEEIEKPILKRKKI